jgi:hypothetical protein
MVNLSETVLDKSGDNNASSSSRKPSGSSSKSNSYYNPIDYQHQPQRLSAIISDYHRLSAPARGVNVKGSGGDRGLQERHADSGKASAQVSGHVPGHFARDLLIKI